MSTSALITTEITVFWEMHSRCKQYGNFFARVLLLRRLLPFGNLIYNERKKCVKRVRFRVRISHICHRIRKSF